jgi:polar amino acid transport system substrate-binding protein
MGDRSQKIPSLAGLLVLTLIAALAAGCGGGSKKSSGTTTATIAATTIAPGVNRKIAAEVPAATKSRGTLIVASDAHYPPDEFIGSDGRTVVGMDPDLAKALAAVMGLKVKVVNASLSTIIPGLAAGRYDLGMSSITDTRQREKTVDFVTYFKAGTTFYTNATGGLAIQHGLADLCGHRVAVGRGTTEESDVTAQSGKCKATGKAGIKIFVYRNQTVASDAVARGQAQVGMADLPVAAYLTVKSNRQYMLTGTPYNVAPYGIALPKGNGMAKPVRDALKVLIASGKYKAILTRWYVNSGAIRKPQINAATS